VLPDGNAPQMIRAAVQIVQQKIANVVLLGNKKDISAANKKNIDLTGIKIVDPNNSEKLDYYARMFFCMRRSKGMTLEKAMETCRDPLYYAVMMVNNHEADGIMAFGQYLKVLKQSE